VYNERLTYKLKQLKGIILTQALIKILEDKEHDWEYDYTTDEKSYINTLFIANKRLI
jgi:hypothetical protein